MERLQKFFSDCGILSRRAAEEEIRLGKVTVNGKTAIIGLCVDPGKDTVLYNGKPVRPTGAARHYLMLHKPKGVVTTLSDEKKRRTVADLTADLGVRVYPVGRLDYNSEGLIFLTDDGAFANRLTHPGSGLPKYYRVSVPSPVSEEQLTRLNGTFLLDGYRTRPARVRRIRTDNTGTELEFVLFEGRNRQIRRMCGEVGLSVQRLVRTAVGKIRLGNLPAGTYRMLTDAEITYLKGETQQ